MDTIFGHLTMNRKKVSLYKRKIRWKLLYLLMLFCYYMEFISQALLLYRSKNAWACIVRLRK